MDDFLGSGPGRAGEDPKIEKRPNLEPDGMISPTHADFGRERGIPSAPVASPGPSPESLAPSKPLPGFGGLLWEAQGTHVE